MARGLKSRYQGMWWLPESPENKVGGVLLLTPDGGARLSLTGSLKGDKLPEKELSRFNLVLGACFGKDITLFDCLQTKMTYNPSYRTSSLLVGRSFIGAHFQDPNDIRFSSISVRYSYLDEWVSISGFDVKFSGSDVAMSYEKPKPIEASIDDSYKLTIHFTTTGPAITHPVQKEVRMRQRTWITVTAQQERSLDDYLELVHRIQNFLSLSISEPVYPLELQGRTETSKIELGEHVIYEPVIIRYRQSNIPVEKKGLLWLDMLFRFEDVRDRLDSCLRKWFTNLEELKSAIDLYFGSLYNPHMYLEHKFLSVVQALESYHRLKMRCDELPEQEHSERIEEIRRAIPKYEDWLTEELRYSNELSLRSRLKELLAAYPEISRDLTDDPSDFVNNVVDTRNYLTHHDPRSKGAAADGEKLFTLTRKLRMLLEACLMTEIGFDKDEIHSIFRQNRRYADLIGRKRAGMSESQLKSANGILSHETQ